MDNSGFGFDYADRNFCNLANFCNFMHFVTFGTQLSFVTFQSNFLGSIRTTSRQSLEVLGSPGEVLGSLSFLVDSWYNPSKILVIPRLRLQHLSGKRRLLLPRTS